MRVRVRLRVRGKEVMTTPVNTGFETERPQVLVPLNLARALSL